MRTNCTSNGRKMTTLWKVGAPESWFRGETNFRCCIGDGALITEWGARMRMREKSESNVQGIAQEKLFSKTADREKERRWLAQVLISSGAVELKVWSFKSPHHHQGHTWWSSGCSCGERRQRPLSRKHIWGSPRLHREKHFHLLECIWKRWHYLLGNKREGIYHWIAC